MPRHAAPSPGRKRNSPRAALREKSVQPPEMGSEAAFVSLARIVRARGRIGEVAATILTDFPERLATLCDVFLLDPAGRRRPARVRRCWLSPSRGGQAVFHFDGVDSINDAEKFVGCEVQIPLAQRAPLPPGRYYVSDLIGCEVFEVQWPRAGEPSSQAEGRAALGTVRDVYFESGTPLLVVATPSGELLIPFAEEICIRTDPGAHRIEVRLPPGLRELNR